MMANKSGKVTYYFSCHLWIFNPKTLSALLGDCGYELMQLNRYRTVRGYYALTALARPTNLL